MAEARLQRRLAAIMSADVVGYSRLMEVDEQLTRARLRALHAELIEPQIAADGGRIVKTMGDGILVEFPSAIEAIRNALFVQGAIRRRNADVPEDIRIALRIGINVGDVIIEGNDIHGDGVNVASRLEGLCEPGGVYVSGTVFDQADGKLAAGFENLGEQKVKNIVKPVRVYRVIDEISIPAWPEPQSADMEPKRSDRVSVAVLPFDNLSNDPEQEYFSDGMAEDLITDISKVSGIFVVARNSSFAFKGQTTDVKEIARRLGVEHVVEGSVRKMGTKLRINAQLIDATSGGHVWAERYDGNLADIFGFQDDIREQIVTALKVSLTPTDRKPTRHKPTHSVEAYDLFLKGRASYFRFSREHLFEAITSLENAIKIDPAFADAYGYLSYCHFQGFNQMLPGFEDGLEQANELAERGVALDATSVITLTRLGWVQVWMRRYESSVSNMEKALALAPSDAEVLATFGNVLSFCGDPERGLRMMEKAFSLEPIAPLSWDFQLGRAYMLLHQLDRAIDRFDRMTERAPTFLPAYTHLAFCYTETGCGEKAERAVTTIKDINPLFTVAALAQRLPYHSDDFRNRFLKQLAEAGLPED